MALASGRRAVPACPGHLGLVEQVNDSPATPHFKLLATATHDTAAVLMGPTHFLPLAFVLKLKWDLGSIFSASSSRQPSPPFTYLSAT